MNKTTLKPAVAAVVLALCLGTASAAFAGPGSQYTGEMRDAWLHGKVETAYALNRHLNPFAIDTDVEDGTVYLHGTVDSDIDRDLAGQIALSVEGVEKVENDLQVAKVEKSKLARATNNLMRKVNDATTTAVVKSKLLANNNTKGLKINVDTQDSVVTLRGTVESDEIKELAEALAENTSDVKRVNNQLKIEKSS